jgi:hypothetical protein
MLKQTVFSGLKNSHKEHREGTEKELHKSLIKKNTSK